MGHTNRTMAQASADQRSKLETGGIDTSSMIAQSMLKNTIDTMTMQGLSTFDLDISNSRFDKLYSYLLKSSTWEEFSTDQNDWDSVSVFINSNNSLRVALIADSLVRFNLIKKD